MREGSYITLFSLSDATAFNRMKYGGGGVILPWFHRVTSLRFTASYSLCDPVHVDIRWISYEEYHPILFHMFSTCIVHMDYWCTYPRVYLVDMKDVYTLINLVGIDLII